MHQLHPDLVLRCAGRLLQAPTKGCSESRILEWPADSHGGEPNAIQSASVQAFEAPQVCQAARKAASIQYVPRFMVSAAVPSRLSMRCKRWSAWIGWRQVRVMLHYHVHQYYVHQAVLGSRTTGLAGSAGDPLRKPFYSGAGINVTLT